MVAKDFDLDKYHPLYPRREILAEYDKVKGIEYEKSVHDRAYEEWHALVKGRKVTQEVSQIYRRKIANEGEFLLYNVLYTGHDWKGNEKDFATLNGRYDKPIFRLEKDPQTQEVTSTQISSHRTIHDIPYTKEKLDELFEMATEPISLIVYGTSGRRLGLQSVEDYREGTIEDLIVSANKGKSLQSVLAEKNQFTYEKRESSGSGSSSNNTTTSNKQRPQKDGSQSLSSSSS